MHVQLYINVLFRQKYTALRRQIQHDPLVNSKLFPCHRSETHTLLSSFWGGFGRWIRAHIPPPRTPFPTAALFKATGGVGVCAIAHISIRKPPRGFCGAEGRSEGTLIAVGRGNPVKNFRRRDQEETPAGRRGRRRCQTPFSSYLFLSGGGGGG